MVSLSPSSLVKSVGEKMSSSQSSVITVQYCTGTEDEQEGREKAKEVAEMASQPGPIKMERLSFLCTLHF